jgi:plastocyanin domain-containing protein
MKYTTKLAPWIALLTIGNVTFAHPAQAAAEEASSATQAEVRVIELTVQGTYQPDRIVVQEGERVQLRVTRKEYNGCTLEIVFPTLGIRRTLPTNETVVIDLGTVVAGEIPFHCGMKMIHGTVVVEPRE